MGNSEFVCEGVGIDKSRIVIRRKEDGNKLILEYIKIVNGKEYISEVVLDKENQMLYGDWFDCEMTVDEVKKAEEIIRSIKNLEEFYSAYNDKLHTLCHDRFRYRELLPKDTIEEAINKTKEYYTHIKLTKEEVEKLKIFKKPIDGMLVIGIDECYDINVCFYEWRLYNKEMKLHEVITIDDEYIHKQLLHTLLKIIKERK